MTNLHTTAEVDMDPQHGPIVRVTIDDVTVEVYLAAKTAVLTTETGRQAGIEVPGPWPKFLRSLAFLHNADQR